MRRVVITGSPGAGKTTLLAELARRGFATVDESARALIRERRALGLSPRPEPVVFAQQILDQDLAKYRRPPDSDPVFFDRSAVEALGMLYAAQPMDGAELSARLSACRYHRRVFVLPPWREIYVTDAERNQSFDDALRIDELTRRWYRRCGYETVDVPTGPVADRCAHVLAALADGEA